MNDINDKAKRRRILVIDDNPAIHGDYRKILEVKPTDALTAAAAALFDDPVGPGAGHTFEIDGAMQGQEGTARVKAALEEGRPYEVAFVDMRMPPGWDGVRTTEELWRIDPRLQVVICTAYSDCSWDEMQERLGIGDRLLILKKPFDSIEVRQLAHALTAKWELAREKEERLADLGARVEREVADRLRLEKDLRHAQKLDALGRLAAGAGHEINNPLAYVLAGLEGSLLLLGDDDKGLAAQLLLHLRPALQGAQRIRDLIENIKTYSDVEEDGPAGPVDVREVLKAAARRGWNQGKPPAELLETYTDIPTVTGHAHRLEQVFVNLLGNAAEALRPGAQRTPIHLRTSCQTTPAGQRTVIIEIEDHGRGIAPADLERVFEPFFSTRLEGKGAGLGLYISRSIVKSLGGEIVIESRLGQGTKVSIRLPAEPIAVTAPAAPPVDAGRVRARVLIVDDEPMVLRAMARSLPGHDVSIASSAQQAIALYQTRPYDVVICDLMMPGMSGMDLHAAIRELGDEHAERILFMTGGAFTPKADKFASGFADRCLHKPVPIAELRQRVDKAFARVVAG